MRDIVDDEQRSYRVLGAQRAAHKPTRPVRERRKFWLPFRLRRRRATGFVAAPYRCPASRASLRLALARRRSQRSPRDFCRGLLEASHS
jgi:hypothetical protein